MAGESCLSMLSGSSVSSIGTNSDICSEGCEGVREGGCEGVREGGCEGVREGCSLWQKLTLSPDLGS